MIRASLLKDVLQKNSEASGHETPKALTSRKSLKHYESSIKSTGGSTIRSIRSIAESVASFYSLMTGGTRIPKRRRPEVSRLGVPKFYRKNPKPILDMEGVKYLDTSELGPWTAAHAMSFGSTDSDAGDAWASVILYSHASSSDPMPIFHGRAKINGELRICVKKPMRITSIDVWLQGRQESILDLALPPFLNATANLWSPQCGDPRKVADRPTLTINTFKEKFPAGTYVFPFEFPALPRDVDVFQMDHRLNMPKHANVFLPPSHEISEVLNWVSWQKYVVGINIRKTGVMAINEEWNFKLDYFPRSRPLLRPEVPFPFLLDHKEWPFSRGDLGGWNLTPFGGRGRFRDVMVEVEGLLGIQAPVVYSPGQRVRFTLLLWSENETMLEALAHPDNIQVDYIRSDIFGLDVLEPHNSARKNRFMLPYGTRGRVWRNDDGSAGTPDAPAPVQVDTMKEKVRTKRAQEVKTIRSNYVPKRFMELYNANAEDVEDTTVMPAIPTFGKAKPEGPSEAAAFVAQLRLGTAETEITSIKGSELIVNDVNDGSIRTFINEQDAPTSKEPFVDQSRSPSPTPSLSDDDEENSMDKKGRIIRLDGDIVVPMSMPPSYRYMYAGVEYSIHVVMTHPDYTHISPRATGVIAEAPIWVVTDPPRKPGEEDELHTSVDLSQLPKTGEAIRVPADAIRFPMATGDATSRVRPTSQGNRTWSFF